MRLNSGSPRIGEGKKNEWVKYGLNQDERDVMRREHVRIGS